jgi:phenylacetate-CoA ligase
VAEVLKRCPAIQRARLVVSGEMANDHMCLKVESQDWNESLQKEVEAAVRDVTKLRATIEAVAPGSLPNDGKVIEDARSYQ